MYMMTMPKRVWVLPTDPMEEPKQVPEERLPEIFAHYPEETGYEPKLEFLYKVIDTDCIDLRVIPGLGTLWLDDNGLLRDTPEVNPIATCLYAKHFMAGAQGHPVVGTCVLVIDPNTPEGADEDELRRCLLAYRRALIAQHSGRN